jgi:hypothetical protein
MDGSTAKRWVVAIAIAGVAYGAYQGFIHWKGSRAKRASLTLLCDTTFIEEAGPFLARQKDPANLTMADLQQAGTELAAEGQRLAAWARRTLPPDDIRALASLPGLPSDIAIAAFTNAQAECPKKFEGVKGATVAALFGFTAAVLAQ